MSELKAENLDNANKFGRICQNKFFCPIVAFALPYLILLCAHLITGLAPFGEDSILSLDLTAQYVHYFAELKDALKGDGSIIYSFARTLGGEFLGIVAYYLCSPFSLIIALFPKTHIELAITIILLSKTGMCGLTMNYYLRKGRRLSVCESLIFSTSYALCSYVAVFGANLMWLDGVFILPILAMGIEKLVSHGKMSLFIFSLAYALFTNYYIGYMLCIFAVIYYLAMFFSEDRQGNMGVEFLKNGAKAVFSAVIAVMCSAAMLLPAYRSLGFGKASFNSPELSVKPTFPLINHISKLFPCVYDAVDYDGAAYIYCGMIVLLLAPLYFILKSVSNKKKIAVGCVTAFICVSLCVYSLDIFWHGFQYPNWLNHRYSFILCFLMCSMAGEVFKKRDEISAKSIYVMAGFLGIVLVQIQIAKLEYFKFIENFLLSFLLIGGYLVILAVFKSEKKRQILNSTVISVVCAELLLSSAVTVYKYGTDVVFAKDGAIENNIAKFTPALDEIKKQDSDFYRTEINGNRRLNDPFSVGFYGISTSTSTFNANVVDFMRSMGYASEAHHTEYKSINPASDAIFGIKYLLSEKDIGNSIHLKTNISPDEKITVYQNPFALPLAYFSSEEIKNVGGDESNSAFENINAVYSALLGENVEIFKKAKLSSFSRYGTVPVTEEGVTYYTDSEKGKEKNLTFRVKCSEGEELYMYFPSPYFEEVDYYVNGEKTGRTNGSGSLCVHYAGKSNGEETEIKLVWTDGMPSIYSDVNYFYTLDRNALENACKKLADGGMKITKFKETRIAGQIESKKDGAVFTSIPFDDDWKVYVDGEETETYKSFYTMLSFDITEGEHEIVFKFVPKSFVKGLIITGIGTLIFVFIFLYEKGKLNKIIAKIPILSKFENKNKKNTDNLNTERGN